MAARFAGLAAVFCLLGHGAILHIRHARRHCFCTMQHVPRPFGAAKGQLQGFAAYTLCMRVQADERGRAEQLKLGNCWS